MERKIGETFEYQGKIYKVAEFDLCRNCAFIHINCSSLRSITGNCMYFFRNDGANVKFEEVKDMEIKDNQLTINIPEGMEIDVENCDFNAGVIKFKKKEIRYEDIEASLKLNENMTGIDVADENVNRLYAINRLMCIAKFYNGDWKPNWSSIENKYHILYCNRSQCYTTDYKTFFDINTVYFKREKDAHAVIDNPNFQKILDANLQKLNNTIMEKELNIAEILKDKPQGTKLYDLLYNVDVELDTISTTDTVIWCTNKTDNNTTCHRGYSEFGTVRGCPDGLQILLPSKEMRDWSKFAWKRGDVLVSDDGCIEVIFDKWYDDTYTSFYGKHYLDSENENDIVYIEAFICTTERFSLEDKESFLCYINTIEERLGGKLNRETLEIEKTQPEFKDGDILSIQEDEEYYHTILIFKGGADVYVYFDCFHRVLTYGTKVDGNEKSIYHLATEEEKQQLFIALAKENKAWDAEKKQIVDLKPKWTYARLNAKIAVLKEIAIDYSGKTIGNIIQQLEAIREEVSNERA